MRSSAEPAAGPPPARTSLAIDHLRAVVILLVIAFHSALAYLAFLPHHPFAFDSPPYLWRSFPIVDPQRWLGFDLFCAWLDVHLMSLFFLLSGLFVWPSLSRKGAATFLADRVLRLALPFTLVVLLLMPLAHYPSYVQSSGAPGIALYWHRLIALPVWPTGPMWFLFSLLVLDIAAAALYRALAGHRQLVARLSSWARHDPARFLAGFLIASALAYVPLALLFGPMAWFQRGPFSFQLARPLHYALYFFGGVAIGACGIERGLAAPGGPLARRLWPWLAAAPASFALWVAMSALTRRGAPPLGLQALADVSFALACFASCFMAVALALRFARLRSAPLASLKDNAYGMFLVHYVFVVWLQYALLPFAWPALAKWAVVFAGSALASWAASSALCRVPAIAQIVGGGRSPAVAAAPAPGREGVAGPAD
jgi:surface polysaccharide O-acyltransferase-like enzyme